jgi:lipopolysaccharide export system ATP-binding protein
MRSPAATPDLSTLSGGSTAASRLEARGLQKRYGARTVVKDVHLAVAAGEVVGLLGPNGAGKTTVLLHDRRPGARRRRRDQHRRPARSDSMPIHRRSRLGLSYLPQEASIFRKLTSRRTCAPCWSCSTTATANRWTRPRSTAA